MNSFPDLYGPKLTKKTTSFVNPLTGVFYSNKDFLKNCNMTLRSSSHLEDIKSSKKIIENGQQLQIQKKLRLKKNHLTKQQRQRIQRQIVAINTTSRLAKPINKPFDGNKTVLLNKKCMRAFDGNGQDLCLSTKNNLSKTFAFHKNPDKRLQNNQSSIHSPKRRAQSIQFFNKQSESTTQLCKSKQLKSVFEHIEILVLDILHNYSDFQTKIVTVNLQKYFRSFFKKQLSGHFTEDFLNKVQYYYEKLLTQQKLDTPVDTLIINQQPQLFRIGSRIAFLEKIKDLESRKSKINEQKILEMIRYHCVPEKDFRESCLRDIILMLNLQIYQKFNCSRQEQYILLNQNGAPITQIMQIKFSTRRLFLTSKKNSTFNYNRYLKLLDQFYNQGKKLTFNQGIKNSFRVKIAKGNLDQDHFNYSQNYQFQAIKRKYEINYAETLLKRRNQFQRLNKVAPRQEKIYFDRPVSGSKGKLNKVQKIAEIQEETNKSPHSNSSKIKQTPQAVPSQFWKIQSTKINSPQPSVLRSSLSPTRNLIPKSPRKSLLQNQKSKLKSFLTVSSHNRLNNEIQKQFKSQFLELVNKNDFLDMEFNHKFGKVRVMNNVMVKHFEYFKGKTQEQIERILKTIKKVGKTLQSEDNLQIQSDIQPFKKSDKRDSSQGKQIFDSDYIQSLSWLQYCNLRTTIQCMQPKQTVMQFISYYLNFNQFGQLSKPELFKQISFILSSQIQTNIIQIIVEVIWSWFQSNSIIENHVIRKVVLESWYEKYKIVYCMLVSLIFGTNHTTALDLAYEVLVQGQ